VASCLVVGTTVGFFTVSIFGTEFPFFSDTLFCLPSLLTLDLLPDDDLGAPFLLDASARLDSPLLSNLPFLIFFLLLSLHSLSIPLSEL
jgi:hypothetical protein